MKSIVQEASSIEKAIFQAWQRAGEPEDFSIRIFETPTKNFFGFTVKSAKIAIFFQEPVKKKESNGKQQQAAQPVQAAAQPVKQARQPRVAPAREQREQKTVEPRATVEKKRAVETDEAQTAKPKNDTPLWSPAMVQYAQKWFDDLFALTEHKGMIYTLDPQRYHLKVSFAIQPFQDEERCKIFYRSCAHLLLQSLRNTCKRPLKGFKVVCTHAA
jgi:predicted RNA-binding protein Jag